MSPVSFHIQNYPIRWLTSSEGKGLLDSVWRNLSITALCACISVAITQNSGQLFSLETKAFISRELVPSFTIRSARMRGEANMVSRDLESSADCLAFYTRSTGKQINATHSILGVA